MNKIFGCGEDAFTIRALKRRTSEILEKLRDQTDPSDCLIFYRPSFGRRGGKGRAEFGEFDAILASSQNIYLIESKRDRFLRNKGSEITLPTEQVLRHRIFSWYLENWNIKKYGGDWEKLASHLQSDFASNFPDKKIPLARSHLAQDLEFVLNRLQKHCERFSREYRKPSNVLLYFHGSRSAEIKTVAAEDLNFKVVNIDYSQYTSGNFLPLN